MSTGANQSIKSFDDLHNQMLEVKNGSRDSIGITKRQAKSLNIGWTHIESLATVLGLKLTLQRSIGFLISRKS